MSDLVECRREGRVMTLLFNRQEKRNAIDAAMFIAITEALILARDNDQIAAVVLTGKGSDFCTGMDLSAADVDLSQVGSDRGWMAPYDRFVDLVSTFPKPLLAAVRGYSVGAGATLLFYCDLVYAGESARFRFPFASLGLTTELGASFTMPMALGPQAAAEILLTADWIDASQALDYGMVRAVFTDDQVLNRTLDAAGRMARWPVSSLSDIKRCIRVARDQGLASAREAEVEGMAELAGSPENIEAMTAFLERRTPDFSKSGNDAE